MTASRFFLALALFLLAACHRKSETESIAAPATPRVAESSWLAPLPPRIIPAAPPSATTTLLPPPRRELTPQQIEHRNTVFEKYGPPTTVAAAVAQAVRLQQEYQTEKEYLPRVEIIYRLADASTPQSREALSRLFFTEKDLDLRVQMVNALPFIDAGDLNLSLPILQEALKPEQPRELKEAGLDTIQSLNDPKTLPLLQSLLNDEDDELRETATKTAEYYKEVLELDVPKR